MSSRRSANSSNVTHQLAYSGQGAAPLRRAIRQLHVDRALRLRPSRRIALQCDSGQTGTSCLQLDCVERRYLLSGTSSGHLTIHDTQMAGSDGDQHNGSRQTLCPVVAQAKSSDAVVDVCWYPLDTGLFASAGADGGRVWDANSLQTVFTAPPTATCVHMSAGHSLLAVAGKQDSVRLCDLRSGSGSHVLRTRGVNRHSAEKPRMLACRWSPVEPNLLAAGGSDAQVSLWDVRSARGPLVTMQPVRGLSSKGIYTRVISVRFTDNGLGVLAAHEDSRGGHGAVTLFDLLSGGRLCCTQEIRFPAVRKNGCCQVCVLENGERRLLFAPSAKDVIISDMTVLPEDSGGFDTLTDSGHWRSKRCQRHEPRRCSVRPLSTGVGRPTAHLSYVTAVELDSDRTMLFSSGGDAGAIVWTADEFENEELMHDGDGRGRGVSDVVSTFYQDQWSDED